MELSDQPWRILMVEDDEDDYVLTRATLAEIEHCQIVLRWAPNYNSGLAALENDAWDAVLLDYDLGEHTGLDFIRELQGRGCRIPAILLTGRGSYTVDVGAMQAGAVDYLSKSEVNSPLLERTIRYAIERFQVQEALIKTKDELELRVQERTLELQQKNEALEAEIAHRQQVQRELAEVQRRLLDRAEKERLELAQDLHDGPMQDLYGLIYQLADIKDQIQDSGLSAGLAACTGSAEQIVDALRTIAGELRPPTLAPYGLERAIRSHAGQFAIAHPGLSVFLELEPDDQALPERVRLALFRIYQIALTNVIRHAEARRVEVGFSVRGSTATLWIKDDGRGFQVPERWFEFAHQGHLGLAGAAERAEALGGSFEVHSLPGQGTTLKVLIPLAEKTGLQEGKVSPAAFW